MKKIFVFLTMAILSMSLFSFTSPKGGDMFEIYLNNQLLLQRHVFGDASPGIVSLKGAGATDVLGIKFLHCAQPGTNRVLQLKDSNEKLLKEWKFSNTNSSAETMNCKVGDLLGFQKSTSLELRLYYSSDQLKKGKLVASIN